ncbi:MAG: cobalt transporter CbiM [Deltaproteobacteria bacterium]|nr:cobalt transporter CbiM [Deltaproteobacteria bacterium]MBW2069117.1 cobalt transporter CbiM [Deltaproteobacteria bacterium]
MHISDGVLPPSVTVVSYVVTAGIVALQLRKLHYADYPKVAVMTSAFFVASLIHVPLGPTSVHLLLPGLTGMVLGPISFLAVTLGLILQCFLFQFGGITALGANALMMGLPAMAAGWIFHRFKMSDLKWNMILAGAIGSGSVICSALILGLLLYVSGEAFWGVAKIAVIAHIPVAIIEGIISASTVSFLQKVKPELLAVATRYPTG